MQRIIDQLYGCRMRDVIYLMDKDKTTKKATKKR